MSHLKYNSTFHFLPGMEEKITWFKDSPNAGDPKCTCSFCGKTITAGEMPVRAFRTSDHSEMRLHIVCAGEVIREFARRKV